MSAINSGPSDRFKTHARQHYVGIRSKKVLISVITDDELVIGIVERETLRDRFNCVSEVRSRCGLLLSRLRQLAGKKGDLLLQIGKRGAASARGRWRVAALQPRRFAVLRFRGFPAYCATPSHVALPVAEPLTYHIVRVVVPHSKIDRSCPSWVLCHEYRRSKRRCATVQCDPHSLSIVTRSPPTRATSGRSLRGGAVA